MDNVLVLVRHGESEWNKLNLFTGCKNPGLTDKGIAEAKRAGALMKAEGLRFDIAYTSVLGRAHHTLDLILAGLGQSGLETIEDAALNERDYGDLCGLNKDEARKKWGADQVQIWRRSYDVRPPGGESLKDTAARVLPYYDLHIWPAVKAGRNVLISAHGNSLRALIMKLEDKTPEEIVKLELGTGVPLVYQLNGDGTVQAKRDLSAGS